jgi:hypothetical protein
MNSGRGSHCPLPHITHFRTLSIIHCTLSISVSVSKSRVDRQVVPASRLHGEAVAPFVFRVSRVSLNPDKLHAVKIAQLQQPLPEIRITGGLVAGAPPTVCPPAPGPSFTYSVRHILRIRIECYVARVAQGFEARDCRHQFHPIVCRKSKTAGNLPRLRVIFQDHPVAAWSRIAGTGAVGVDIDMFTFRGRLRLVECHEWPFRLIGPSAVRDRASALDQRLTLSRLAHGAMHVFARHTDYSTLPYRRKKASQPSGC